MKTSEGSTHWEGSQLVVRRPGFPELRLHESIVELVQATDPKATGRDWHISLSADQCSIGDSIRDADGNLWTVDVLGEGLVWRGHWNNRDNVKSAVTGRLVHKS